MKPNGYAYQLRTLREAERRKNRDYTDQALVVLGLRLDSISAMDVDEQRKQRLRDDAMRQWEVFMQRPIPANG